MFTMVLIFMLIQFYVDLQIMNQHKKIHDTLELHLEQ